jgi:hypothetical protein
MKPDDWIIEKDREGTGHGILYDDIPAIAWRKCGRGGDTEKPVATVGLQNENPIRNIWNMKQVSYPPVDGIQCSDTDRYRSTASLQYGAQECTVKQGTFTELSYLEPASRSAAQGFLFMLGNLKVHYLVRKSPPLGPFPAPDEFKSTPLHYMSMITSNTNVPPTSRSS